MVVVVSCGVGLSPAMSVTPIPIEGNCKSILEKRHSKDSIEKICLRGTKVWQKVIEESWIGVTG